MLWPMTLRTLWHDAAALSARAHLGQWRRDGTTPYVAHPTRVALIVATRFGVTDESVLAAALLHDVIEDSGIDYDDIAEGFGTGVADVVAALSKDPRLVEPAREHAYDEQLAAGPWEARLIKLADVYDNLLDAADAVRRERMLSRAERALALAAGDDRLDRATSALRELVASLAHEDGR
jgi:guanosine-3',5'-bis(diphosphate) 3'-pyrophosphohydrolase